MASRSWVAAYLVAIAGPPLGWALWQESRPAPVDTRPGLVAPTAATPLPPEPERKAAPYAGRMFKGYPCTQDCSGHSAGYRWAERRGIDDRDDCGGNSDSFIEGCWAYVDEQSDAESTEDEDR